MIILQITINKELLAAAFGPAKSLINVPIAEYFIPGDLEFSTNAGFGSMQNLEFDFKFQYSLTKKINIGATIINYHQMVFNAQTTFVTLSDPFPITISAGILNLSSKLDLSDWDNETAQKIHNLGHFIVCSLPKKAYTLHIGLGKKKYRTESINSTLEEASSAFIGTLFFGIEKSIKNGSLMAEFDGSYMNVGYRKKLTKKTTGSAALTEFGNTGKDAPVRFLSFNIKTAKNIFEAYKEEVEYVQKNLTIIEDISLNLKETEKKLKKELINTQKIKEALLKKVNENPSEKKINRKDPLQMYSNNYIQAYKHYEDSFNSFNQQNYLSVLESLTKAIQAAPDVPIFYRQRGTVYYIIKQEENALLDWTTAYELNPRDPELLKLPKSVLTEIISRVKTYPLE